MMSDDFASSVRHSKSASRRALNASHIYRHGAWSLSALPPASTIHAYIYIIRVPEMGAFTQKAKA